MITINGVSVYFGGVELFGDISFQVGKRDRIGLVGRNGAGKTTLLRIVAGELEPQSGEVSVPSGTKIGYLPQQMVHKDGKTLFNETLSAFTEIRALEKQIEELNTLISGRTDYESPGYMELIEKLSETTERFRILGGDTVNARVERVLHGLGFRSADFGRKTEEFSGGWRMRIELAKILLREPDLLLLDEPTNHLDIESIQWLEVFLADFSGAVILISHDRALLDALTNRTIEISLGRTYDYKAPYSKYVELRRERREQQMAAYTNQQKEIRDTEKFIERFRYKATKAVQVQSRIKHLEKIERVEIDQEDLSSINVTFPPSPRAGSIVVEMEGVSKSYGDIKVLQNIDLIIERGEKIAFVGRNGEGKTTLSRIISGELDYSGKFIPGHNVKIGYFAQNQDELLDEEKTVLETIDSIAAGEVRKKIRGILGAFLFSDEEVEKKVKVLSGGERSRLAIAKMLLEPCNLLVLDEPTNHLDMHSKDVLKQALVKYDGTVIVVSHDREFLDGLVSKIYEFRNRKLSEHTGGIYDFLRRRNIGCLTQLETPAEKGKTIRKESIFSENKINYNKKREQEREIRKVVTKIGKTERVIEKLEGAIEEMDKQIASPDKSSEKMDDGDFFARYENYKSELEEEMENWEKLSTQLEKMQKDLSILKR